MKDQISLGLHCEFADILNAYTRMVEQDTSLSGLRAYSAARPAHSEDLAVFVASYLAHETNCPNINWRRSIRRFVNAPTLSFSGKSCWPETCR